MVYADMDVKDSPSLPPDRSPLALAAAERSLTDDELRWLTCAAHMAAAGKAAAQRLYGTPSGRSYLGRGAGGDRTLEIDRACEEAIRGVLEVEAPGDHRLVSEEAGISGSIGAPWCVVVDPLDGSLNAKHGLEPFGASIGVAQGDTLGDVLVGYVEDYLRPHAFAAIKDAGLLLAGEPGSGTTALLEPQRFDSDLIELVLLEAGRPDRHHFPFYELSHIAACGRSGDMRVRQIGSIALALCYLAIGVADVLVAAVRARSVDLAAGLVILREAGGGVGALTDSDYWSQPLDLEKRGAFVAWRRGLNGVEITSRARRLRTALLMSP
jgi:myo-inositol-1(or 4)-monophosphatase